jgi:hypothetical protein
MKNRALLLVFGAALAASACSFLAPASTGGAYDAERTEIRKLHPKLKDCDADECTVIVTVTGEPCDKTKIKADPDDLAVVRTHRGVLIKWKVTTAGYTFDRRDGIVFKSAQSQFQCHASNQATEYECRNKNEDRKDYPYSITLVKDGARCFTDPTIINGY